MAKVFELEQDAQQVLLGLEQAEQCNPATSPLFERTKQLVCDLLSNAPGFNILRLLWHAVFVLRQKAKTDPQIGAAFITVRVAGREADNLKFVHFEFIDDALYVG